MSLLLFLSLLLNPFFSHGLAHWQHDAGWFSGNERAIFQQYNPEPDFLSIRRYNLCQTVNVDPTKELHGSLRYKVLTHAGFLYTSIEQNGKTEPIAYANQSGYLKWSRLEFTAQPTSPKLKFCVTSAVYGGGDTPLILKITRAVLKQ